MIVLSARLVFAIIQVACTFFLHNIVNIFSIYGTNKMKKLNSFTNYSGRKVPSLKMRMVFFFRRRRGVELLIGSRPLITRPDWFAAS